MANKQQLINEVAREIGWSQTDVERALDEFGYASTKEEIYACCLRFAGPELRKRNYQLGALKRVSNNHKETIKNLVEELTSVQDFYGNKFVPTLKATINAQKTYIKDLLKQMPWAREESVNE